MTCVDCNSTLVKTHVELEEGFLTCWTCDCSKVEYVDAEDVGVIDAN